MSAVVLLSNISASFADDVNFQIMILEVPQIDA
ncbi:MAG: hypothetical protein CMIDDMOC_00753 [Sodalis sp. Fle]|nr:MAG: hypothetical protein CMIDDMOC_00753 [Sodalis sp. Fle]